MELEERQVEAMERIADALECWCKLEQQRFDKEYPVKRDVTDATVTVPETEDERLRKLLHSATPEEIEEYIGPRELAFLKRPEPSPQKPSSKRSKKRVSPKTAKGK